MDMNTNNPLETVIHLTPDQFSEADRTLVTYGSLKAHSRRYASGVAGVRLTHAHGQLIVLPFQGQQIWSAAFEAPGVPWRNLTMRSMFGQPRPTQDFLATFGGFLQHCGLAGVGGPGPEDTHPLHGELPNAPYDTAYLVTGEDARGPYLGIGGTYQYTVAFGTNYRAEPLVKLYAGASTFTVGMTITNLKRAPIEVMYLAHVNFRPVDGGRLVYSAPASNVRVRAEIPSHIHPGPGYAEFLAELAADPSRHEVFKPDLNFDPEMVFFIDYAADADGWAHSMQVHPDGSADLIRHRLDQLPKGTRWISRTPDQDAVAIVEAGTCLPEGYRAVKAAGGELVLEPGEQFHCDFEIGLLAPDEAARLEQHIQQIIADRGNSG
ncbi:MAG: DUF4432 family protein [Anaerolineae bacterium]|nr:DUF4432 family protein [Anaerolineae bacterium]